MEKTKEESWEKVMGWGGARRTSKICTSTWASSAAYVSCRDDRGRASQFDTCTPSDSKVVPK